MAKQYQVYVLENQMGRRYIGLSEDPEKRLLQHNAGQSKWTSNFRPWRMIWKSRPLTLSQARILENLMKRQKGGKGLTSIMLQHG